MIRINASVSIPESELWFTASRASGPGGQNVNKVSSRVTLHFDVVASPSLDDAQKRRVADQLATRITKSGILKLDSQRHRSQAANRLVLIERFENLLRSALTPPKRRRKTRVPRAAKERRLEAKRIRGKVKRNRGKPSQDDG